MLDDRFVLDCDHKKIFPKHYVTRFVPKILINIDALKKVDDLFVVVCGDNTEIVKVELERLNTEECQSHYFQVLVRTKIKMLTVRTILFNE
jgi:hypothetical protein